MDGFSTATVKDDTDPTDGPDAQFVKKPGVTSLKSIFGKAAALLSLAGTLAFYSLGFNICSGYYHRWQDSKTGITQKWDYKDPTDKLPWLPAGGALALSFGAGAAGIAAGRSRRKDLKDYYASNYSGGSPAYYNNYGGGDDWFFWYWLGRSSSGSGGGGSSSSSSSDDNSGMALVLVAGAALALAAGASIVSYEALHKNFGEQGLKRKSDPQFRL